MKRREFIASTAVAGLANQSLMGAKQELPKRPYRDGVQLSAVGFGGIVVMGLEQEKENHVVSDAVAQGLNYFDVAPSYGDGEAEQKLGVALQPYPKNVFLACKAEKRDAAGARAQLETSLRRLKADHFDLYQFHAVKSLEEVKQILGPGGAAETFTKAKKDG